MAIRPALVSTPVTRPPSVSTLKTSTPVSIVAPRLRAPSANANAVAAGSAKPESASHAAAPTSAVSQPGRISRTSAGVISFVTMPRRCWRATLRASAAAYWGPTSCTKPTPSKPQSPPTTSPKFRKTFRLSRAMRDSVSLV